MFAVSIAHRREPTTLSVTVVTVNVAVTTGGPEVPERKPLSIVVFDDCAEPIASSPTTDWALVVADAIDINKRLYTKWFNGVHINVIVKEINQELVREVLYCASAEGYRTLQAPE